MLRIDAERLYRSIHDLGRIGAYVDEATGLTGVNRLALTDADGEGRRHVVAAMRALGLDVIIDRIGNVYARRAGREPALGPVVIGSHIDSVPTGGMFDGCLGVLGGLEIVRRLDEAGVRTRRPLVVAFFTDEEGSRFGTDMLGSAVATGRLALEHAYGLRDRQGRVLREELARIGFAGEAPVEAIRREPPHAYLECHIEQGPILGASGRDIGVVTGVQAIGWQELTITGKSAHAGTTPMHLRADAGVAAAKINLHLRHMIAGGRFGTALRATMGAIAPHPGMVNIVPGRVLATVDLRHPADDALREAEAELVGYYAQVEAEERVRIEWRRTARTEAVAFDAKLQERIATAAGALGLASDRIMSGAGHDAQEFAQLCPAAMVFVPGEHDGISHNPRELSTVQQCADGVDVLLQVVLVLAEE
jgi:beta-ureidopropionase / N-carbamoyl-L-amino-acid hydrolase